MNFYDYYKHNGNYQHISYEKIDELIALLKDRKGDLSTSNILEVGAATGILSMELSKVFSRVYAMEHSIDKYTQSVREHKRLNAITNITVTEDDNLEEFITRRSGTGQTLRSINILYFDHSEKVNINHIVNAISQPGNRFMSLELIIRRTEEDDFEVVYDIATARHQPNITEVVPAAPVEVDIPPSDPPPAVEEVKEEVVEEVKEEVKEEVVEEIKEEVKEEVKPKKPRAKRKSRKTTSS